MNPGRVILCSLVSLVLVPAVALAAAKPGSYSGVSNASIFEYGDTEPRTDKGKVTFTVRSDKVLNFRVTGQRFMCGTGHQEVPITVRTIKLNSSGKGTATYNNPDVGAFTVAITVTSGGKASGTLKPTGLCQREYPGRFTAKRG